MGGRHDGPGPVIGLTGARFGSPSRRRRTARPEPAAPAPPPLPARPPTVDPGPVPAPLSAIVRPYVLTRGRTRAGTELALDALVTTAPGPGPVGEPVEHARIRELCRVPRSVAEVAALLGVPLGVAQVLLADLLAEGGVTVRRTVADGGPDHALLERVLAGLRRL